VARPGRAAHRITSRSDRATAPSLSIAPVIGLFQHCYTVVGEQSEVSSPGCQGLRRAVVNLWRWHASADLDEKRRG
jgi:hypothetical protein